MLSSSTHLDSPRLTKRRMSPKMVSMSRSESLLPARSCSRSGLGVGLGLGLRLGLGLGRAGNELCKRLLEVMRDQLG